LLISIGKTPNLSSTPLNENAIINLE